MKLLAAILLVACSDPATTPPAGDDTALRYPSTLLPYRVNPDAIRDRLEPKANYAIAALGPELVAVVFPPADATGFDVAWGGWDVPWTRAHLVDVAARDVAMLDAIGDTDGTLHVVMRAAADDALTYITWRPDRAPTIAALPRADANLSPTLTRVGLIGSCPDLRLDFAPNGDLGLTYRGYFADPEPDGPPYAYSGIYYARLPAGGTTFAHQLAASPLGPTRPVDFGKLADIGCRNVLAHDVISEPVIMTSDKEFDGPLVTSYVRGKDGEFHPTGPDLRPEDRTTYRSQFDLERHPEGFLLAGTSTQNGLLYLSEWTRLPGGKFTGTIDDTRGGFSAELHYSVGYDSKSGGKLIVGGGAELWTDPPNMPGVGPVAIAGGASLYSSAPVMEREADARADLEYAVFTHGDRPFSAALCSNAAGDLAICAGMYRPPNPEFPVTREQCLVQVASSSIPDRATDVHFPPGSSLTITLDGWWDVDNGNHPSDPIPVVTDQFNGDHANSDYTLDRDAHTITVTFPLGLFEGHMYQVNLQPPGGCKPHMWGGATYPQLTFSTGSPAVTNGPDARDVPMTTYGPFHDPDGHLIYPNVNPEVGVVVTFYLDRRYLAPKTEVLHVFDSSNVEVVTETTYKPATHTINLSWPNQLAENATYRVELPTLRDDEYGTDLDVASRTATIQTTVVPPP